jgi:hypothetical protein
MNHNFDLLFNGAPIPNSKLVIPSNASTNRQVSIVFADGAQGAGKLFTIQTSAPLFISAVNGALDANGRFNLTIGPGFGARGDVTITVKLGNKTKSLDIQFI